MRQSLQTLHKEINGSFARNVLYQNPVLTGALGICTIVAAATTLKNAWILTQMFALITFPVCMISSGCFSRMPRYLRAAVVPLTAAILYTLAIALLRSYYGAWSTLFRFYLPLMAVNSLMLSRAVRYAPRQRLWVTAIDTVTCIIGFGLAACLTGGIRELFQSGKLTGLPVHMAGVPFFGFIVLGFIAAAVRGLRLHRERKRAAARRVARRKEGARP